MTLVGRSGNGSVHAVQRAGVRSSTDNGLVSIASPAGTASRPPVRELATDVLVVGAGPSGSAAAAWCARGGLDVILADAAEFPRDKACGDGLTPRAIDELHKLGLSTWLSEQQGNRGLRAAGFSQELYLPWPGGSLPDHGAAVSRMVLDAAIRDVALVAGAQALSGYRALDAQHDGRRVTGVTFRGAEGPVTVRCDRLVVADGARSQLGRVLGRQWHRSTAYGVAIRAYVSSARSDDSWISSHLELRGLTGDLLSGYGWIFPLGSGRVNIGVGTLATARRPAELNLRDLLDQYAAGQQGAWELDGPLEAPASALLPMGGAVSGVSGANWMLIGDAAGCVNPLNGEGIDYGLETGHLAADLLVQQSSPADLAAVWPNLLRARYGSAFSVARRLAALLTVPGLLSTLGPIGMRSHGLMTVALRVMGNLVTEEDRDLTAWAWRRAGRISMGVDRRPPFT